MTFFIVQRRSTYTIHLSKTMTTRLNTRFLVTAVALDGICSTLQPLFRLYSVIYELHGNNLILSDLVAALISVVMSWFSDFWSFSALTLEWSGSRYTWRCCGFRDLLLLVLLFSWKPLLYSFALFVQLETSAALLQHPTFADPELS